MCRDLFLHPLYHEDLQMSTEFRITMENLGLSVGLGGQYPPVGSDALVAPKPQTFYFLMGRDIV